MSSNLTAPAKRKTTLYGWFFFWFEVKLDLNSRRSEFDYNSVGNELKKLAVNYKRDQQNLKTLMTDADIAELLRNELTPVYLNRKFKVLAIFLS